MISFCRRCSFPTEIKILPSLKIKKYDGRYIGSGENIRYWDSLCDDMIEMRKEILNVIENANGVDDLGLDYLCDDYYIECTECGGSYWLSEVVLYLKGIDDFLSDGSNAFTLKRIANELEEKYKND